MADFFKLASRCFGIGKPLRGYPAGYFLLCTSTAYAALHCVQVSKCITRLVEGFRHPCLHMNQ